MKTQLLCVLFAGYLLCLVNKVTAQEYYDGTNTPRQYYYNNLESATAGSPSTFLSAAGSTRNSSSTTIDLVSGSSLNSSKSLSSVGLNSIGYIRWNFMSSSGSAAGLSLANNTWEWEFDYKNVTGATSADPAVTMAASTGSSTDSWRYWLIANAYTTNTSTDYTKGLYLTQAGGNLILRAKYGTANNQYTTYATISMPNSSTTTYQIRVVKSVIGYYYIYILNRLTNATTTTGPVNVGTSVSGVDLNTYNYSYLESSTSASNRFQWDNFNFYQQKVDYVPITSAANGITTGPIYAGQSGIIPYGVNVNVRGDINFGRLRFNSSTNGQALFSSGTLYYTYNSILSVSTAAGSITTTSFNSSNTQQMDVNQYYYSPGNTDGSTANVVNFFIVATTQNPFFSGYPSSISFSVSSAAADDFQSFYTSGYFPFSGTSSTSGATITTGTIYDWIGTQTGGLWATGSNWSPTGVPGSNDMARIGINQTYTYSPVVASSATVGTIQMGPKKGLNSFGFYSVTLTVNQPLTVNNAFTVSSDFSQALSSVNIAGTANISVGGNLVLGDNTSPTAGNLFANNINYTNTGKMTIAGNINLSSTVNTYAGGNYFLPVFNISAGTVNATGISTSVGTAGFLGNAASVVVSNATLQLTGSTALSGLSSAVNNTVTFNGAGATIDYSGANQTAYTSSGITGLSGGVSYTNLILSGTGTKTVGTATGGALTISTNLTTSATTDLDTYDPTVTVGGNWTNSANVTQGSGNIAVTGNYTNTANTLKLGSGSMFVTGNFTNTAGTITGSTSTASLAISGALSNSGTITGNAQAIAVSGSATNNSIFTAGSGTVTIAGAYSNSSTGTFTATTGIVNYNGDYSNAGTFTAGTGMVNFTKAGVQALFDNSTSGSTFNNVTIGNSGTKTMSASGTGKFAISSAGVLTMGGTATLAAGGVLTLNSDITGSATVASIPSGTAITGNVNVQRYINGGASKYRGYRLLTSSVNTGAPVKVFTLAYLKNNAFVTGTTLAAGGFDVSPGANNPSIYFFKESQPANQSSFTSGYYRGVNSLTSPYSFDGETGNRSIGIGNGFLFFFRGDRTAAGAISNAIVTTYIPQPTTMTETGTLNQGDVTVANWYNGTSTLQYSSPAVNTLQGYNLVGNPYASTINFEKFNRKGTSGNAADKSSSIYISGQKAQIYTTTTSKIPPLAYIWVYNVTTKNFESYQQYAGQINSVNDTTTTVNPGVQSVLGGAASNMIASGQGFFVIANGSSQALSFRESAKVTTQPSSTTLAGVFSLPQNNAPIAQALGTGSKAIMSSVNTPIAAAAATTTETVTQPSPMLHLLLEKDTANFDGIALVFDKWATANYSKDKDAEDLGGNGALESFSALTSDSIKTSIHHRPLPGKTQDIIPLFADATTSGPYKIKLADVKDLPAIYEVWLKDNFTKDSVDIKHSNVYSYNIDKSTPATYGKDRFQLVLRQNPELALQLLDFKAIKAIEGAKTTWVVENEVNYTTFTLQRSTDNGKTWDDLKVIQSESLGTYSYTDPNPAKDLNKYRVQLTDLNNDISLSKELPLMYANTQSNISNNLLTVYPNPVQETLNLTISQTNSSANYNIQLTNSSGMILKTVNITQLYWKNNVASFVPGTYIIRVIDNKTKQLIGTCKFVKL